MGPRVSVIINNYNYGCYLPYAIESALAQTYPTVETVVVDDGSTDGSAEVLSAYAGRCAIVSKENGGQGSAINAGFAASTGDLVLFLDSDDFLAPHAVDEFVRQWRPGLGKLHFRLRITDERGKPTKATNPTGALDDGELLPRVLAIGSYISAPTSGNVFARELLRDILPMPEKAWRAGADGYLVYCAALRGPVLALQQPLGYYRAHPRSATNMSGSKNIDPAKISKLLSDDLRRRALLEELVASRECRLAPEAVTSTWSHLKLRLTASKLRLDHPGFPGDSTPKLLSATLRSIKRDTASSLAVKLLRALWAVLVAGTPAVGSGYLLFLGFAPDKRPAIFTRLLERRTAGAAHPSSWFS
jgi:hypothetical protein